MEKIDNKLSFIDLKEIIVFGFDLDNNKYVYIDDCENGLNCGLICRFCNNPLSAKNNCTSKRNHFAHKAGSDCKKGHESTIPLLLKKVLEDHKVIQLPPYHCRVDSSIIHEYKKMAVCAVNLERYEDDLSFNVIVTTDVGMEIAIIPYMKSKDIYSRFVDAKNRYKNVLGLDFDIFKKTNNSVEDTIEEIVIGGRYPNVKNWIANEEEPRLKALYNEKRKRVLEETREQRKYPVIIKGVPRYYIEGIEAFANRKKKIFIENNTNLIYLIDFSKPYKTETGLLLGRRLDENGVVSNELEIIKNQDNDLWTIR